MKKGRGKKKEATPPSTPVRRSNPQSLIRRFLLLTKDLRKKEGWTVEMAARQLANQIEFITDLDEFYPVNKEDDDDPRPDLVSEVLTGIGFVWTRTAGDRDKETATWNTTGLTYERWQEHVASLQELSEELRRDKYGNTPTRPRTSSRVRFDLDTDDDEESPTPEPTSTKDKGKRKRGEEEPTPGEGGERSADGPSPADLAANAELMRAAKEALQGGPQETSARGASGERTPVNYDLPQSRAMASGLFFEEGSSGVPELKKRKKMSYARWSEYNGHLADRIADAVERKAYRSYTALVTRFYTNSKGEKWVTLLDVDEEVRDMIRSGELDGFDDSRILERFLSEPALMSTGGGGGGGRKPKGAGRDKGKGGADKANTPCRFHKSPAGCKKGDNCDFKH